MASPKFSQELLGILVAGEMSQGVNIRLCLVLNSSLRQHTVGGTYNLKLVTLRIQQGAFAPK
jgi:hypothetical protein